MSKRGFSGQLNLFDFWGDTNSEDSIVEMVSLVPDDLPVFESVKAEDLLSGESKDKENIVAEEKIQIEKSSKETEASNEENHLVVMHKEVRGKDLSIIAEISYMNYNKVFLKNENYPKGQLFEFDNSKEAVDFYITQMMLLTGEE